MLLQVITTHAVKAWHYLLKTYAGSKKFIETFVFFNVISYVLFIGNEWEQRATNLEVLYFKTCIIKYSNYSELEKFLGLIQFLIVNQLKVANKANKKNINYYIFILI